MGLQIPLGQIREKHLSWDLRNKINKLVGGGATIGVSVGGTSELIEVPLCRAATTGNITLSGEQTIDNVSLTTGNLVLVWQQTNAVENGLYKVDSSTWLRFEQTLQSGMPIVVREGDDNADTMFLLTTDSFIVDTDPINFIIYGKGGGGGTIQDPTTLAIRAADEGTVTGNTRGNNSVDLQTVRNNAANVASGDQSAIITGIDNKVDGNTSGILAGQTNSLTSSGSFIGAGQSNTSSGANDCAICAGTNNNTTAGGRNFIGAGASNEARQLNSCVVAGGVNKAYGANSGIVSGASNTVGSSYGFVGAGQSNTVNSSHSSIVAGYRNTINLNSLYSFIAGGSENRTLNYYTTCLSGYGLECNYQGEVSNGYNWSNNTKKRQNSSLSWQGSSSDNTSLVNLGITGSDEFITETNHSYHLRVHIFGRDTVTNAVKYYEIDILCRNLAGVVSINYGTINSNTDGGDVFTYSVAANQTNKALELKVQNVFNNLCLYQANAEILQTIEH